MHICTFNNCELQSVVGDITTVQADALIAPINSYGDWESGVHTAIRTADGEQFHSQAADAMPLIDGMSINAVRREDGAQRSRYGNVLFVVDDWKRPLDEVTRRVLCDADEMGFRYLSILSMRTGRALGKFEPDVRSAFVAQMRGMRMFMEHMNANVRRITLVLLPGSEIHRDLSRAFAL